MVEDKIAAMWEEDGDLKLLQDFFGSLPQDENLKERIKAKTLAKIADFDQEVPKISTMGDQKAQQDTKKNIFLLSSLKNQLKARKNTLKIFSAAAVVVFAVYLGAIGMNMQGDSPLKVGSSQKSAQDTGFGNGGMAAPAAPPTASDSAPELFSTKAKNENRQSLNKADVDTKIMLDGEASISADTMESKIIYILEATLKTDDVLGSVAGVEEKVKSIGGYVAESRQNNDQDQTNAYLTLRVPIKEFENFRGNLADFGTISSQNLFTDDVSLEYFDVETRLRSWEAQEKRYLEILQQAKTVEDILRIEDSLANVRREMESLKGQLKYWDNRVEYSEIRLNIIPNKSNLSVNDPWQPVSLQSTLNAAKNAIIKSVSFLWNSVNYLVVFIGYALPAIIILAAAWFIYRRYKQSQRNE